jgi:hypothetical protein
MATTRAATRSTDDVHGEDPVTVIAEKQPTVEMVPVEDDGAKAKKKKKVTKKGKKGKKVDDGGSESNNQAEAIQLNEEKSAGKADVNLKDKLIGEGKPDSDPSRVVSA